MKRFNKIVLLPVLALALVASFVFGIVSLGLIKTVNAESTWGVCGTINSWSSDVEMVDQGDGTFKSSAIAFKHGDEFKVRKDGAWAESYPAGNWAFTDYFEEGDYYVVFNYNKKDDNPISLQKVETVVPVTYTTVYLYTTDWESPCVYAWKGDNENNEWPGEAMTAVDGKDGFWSYAVAETYESIIFNNNGASESTTLSVGNGDNYYYYGGAWYATSDDVEAKIAEEQAIADAQAAMAAKGGYFLIGKINGETNWNYSVNRFMTMVDNENTAEYWHVELKEGDVISGCNAERNVWYHFSRGNANNKSILTFDDDNNGVVKADGVYNVYLKGGALYIAEALEENFDIQKAKLKISADGEYVLLVAGITLDEKEQYIGYNIGFVVNGKLYSGMTYYTAVEYRVDAEDDSKTETKTVEDIYGNEANALIVEEIALSDLGSPETLEVCAYVYNGSTVVDCGNIYTKTLVS